VTSRRIPDYALIRDRPWWRTAKMAITPGPEFFAIFAIFAKFGVALLHRPDSALQKPAWPANEHLRAVAAVSE
jgi:hypothetical protein